MTPETLIALIVFLLPLAYSPGPGNMFFALNGGRHGFMAVLPALWGYHIATLLVTLAIGYGAAVSFSSYPMLAKALTWASAAYLLYIAFSMVRAFFAPQTHDTAAKAEVHRPGFWAGAVLLLFNPKAYAIIAAMFAAFTSLTETPMGLVALSLAFTINNMIAFILWALAGQAFLGRLQSRPALLVYAAAFFAVALWMLLH